MKKTKIPKPTIKSLLESNKRLAQMLTDAEWKLSQNEGREYDLRKAICEILLNGNGYVPAYRASSSEVKTWGEIKAWIGRLTGQVTKEGEMARWINRDRDMESARLWYLMRVAMNDPKLEVPVQPDTRLDIFGNEPPRPKQY